MSEIYGGLCEDRALEGESIAECNHMGLYCNFTAFWRLPEYRSDTIKGVVGYPGQVRLSQAASAQNCLGKEPCLSRAKKSLVKRKESHEIPGLGKA